MNATLRRSLFLGAILGIGCGGPNSEPGPSAVEPLTDAPATLAGAEGPGTKALKTSLALEPGESSIRLPRRPPAYAPPPAPERIELGRDETSFYPRWAELAFAEVNTRGETLILRLRSDRPAFASVAYGRMDSLTVMGPELGDTAKPIELDLGAEPEQLGLVYWLQAVDADGTRSTPLLIGVSYYSAELYAANGRTAEGVIVLDWSDIPFSTTSISDWILDSPTAADREFAEATWGERVRAETTSEGKARALAMAILDRVDLSRGVPSEEQSAQRPFEQYRRAAAGLDHLWCDNFVKIYLRAATCLGLRVRRIELSGKELDVDGISIVTADGHATTEYYDAERDRWIWIDLTANVLGATRANGAPMSVAAFHRSFNDPDGDPIALEIYDPASGTISTSYLEPDNPRWGLKRFFNVGQRYYYYRRVPR